MSYASVAAIRQDPWLRDRIAACVAVECTSTPEEWGQAHAWQLAAQPGWADAWDSALVAHEDDPAYRPGQDPGVISDAMILAGVQAIATEEAT